MMKARFAATLFALLVAPAALSAQGAFQTAAATADRPAVESPTPSLRDRLMPAGSFVMVDAPAPVVAGEKMGARKPIEPAIAGHRSGTPYMIAGAALFLAGILIDNSAGTVLELAGAGIGAYGLYLYFR